MMSMYDLTMKCKGNKEAKDILSGILEAGRHQLDALLKNAKVDQFNHNVSDSLIVEDDVHIKNPRCAKTRGISNSRIVRHWDKSKRGKRKGKVHCSNVKTIKRKRPCSKETTHIQHSQETSHTTLSQILPFSAQFEISQAHPYYQFLMQGGGNIQVGVLSHPFENPYQQ
ncbi:hypothetical protein C2S53_015783 [Perilla frutescens var. hirtella]|uniref:Uncharacterized protein n=1 Tax=Perilla frutescens var. hirtella TaxID=608512 RepID=A0AAD4P6B6_PERFH|nr:hypothetical protein C2S53_015783 [Perilla frutescens var. hirtella]